MSSHIIRVSHEVQGGFATDGETTVLEGMDVRSLRWWLHDAIRRDHNKSATKLLSVLNSCVRAQAYEQGQHDARMGEFRLAQSAQPLWKEGYSEGYAHRMSAQADESDRRMAIEEHQHDRRK